MTEFLTLSLVLLWIIVLLNLALTLALIRRAASGTGHVQPDGIPKGRTAPNFVANTLSGEEVSLANFDNRSVFFIFISPDCVPCREALPSYGALQLKAQRAGVEMVLVSIGDIARTQSLIDEFDIKIPVLVAPRESNAFFNDYKVTGTPFFYLLNKKHKVESAGYPSLEANGWPDFVDASIPGNRQGAKSSVS